MIRSSALVLICALSLAACGQSEAPSNDAPAAPAAETATPTTAQASPEEIAAAIAALPAPYNAADYEAGRRIFAQCRSCHTVGEGEPNRVGPNLHGVFGRQAGAVEGFNYSDAVRNSNITWDAAQIDHWLENPRTFLPGNRMAFVGIRDETQRRDLLAYLMVETD